METNSTDDTVVGAVCLLSVLTLLCAEKKRMNCDLQALQLYRSERSTVYCTVTDVLSTVAVRWEHHRSRINHHEP